jgi:two-component sensor histidine kinase
MARVAAEALDLRLRVRQLNDALLEKALLAREADHRIANSLQLVQAALSLQAAAVSDAGAALRAAARRVAAVAEAHRHLYRAGAPVLSVSEAETPPDAATYLAALVRQLSASAVRDGLAADGAVVLRAVPGAVTVPAGLLPRLGLIAAELVINALKHGTGRVLVELRPGADEEGGAVLAVSDEGVGFPVDFDPEAGGGGGLGMRLLVVLARPGRVWVDPEDRRRMLVQLVGRAAAADS